MHTEHSKYNSSAINQDLLSLSFINQVNSFYFSKTEHAKYPELVFSIVNNFKNSNQYKIDRLLALVSSGIPFASTLSQALHIPLHFYHRFGFTITKNNKEVTYRILPTLPYGKSIYLVDSHARRRRSAFECSKFLFDNKIDINVKGLITLFGLDQFSSGTYSLRFPEISLISFSDNSGFLQKTIVPQNNKNGYSDIFNVDSNIWNTRKSATKISEKINISARIINSLTNKEKISPPTIINKNINILISQFANFKTENGIWEIISDPNVIKLISEEINISELFNKFDALVGVSVIGSVLAWRLAYQSSFCRPIYSIYKDPKIIPAPEDSLRNKEVLLVQGRIITGLDTEAAINRINKYGGECKNVLSFWWMPDKNNNERCAPIRRLQQRKTNFLTIAN